MKLQISKKKIVLFLLLVLATTNLKTQNTEKCCGDQVTNSSIKLTSFYLGKQGDPLPDNSFDKKNISTDVAVVTFEKGDGMYAFDTWLDIYKEISKINGKYDHLANGKTQYHVPWKLLLVGKNDKVKAVISINKDYKDNKGKELDPKNVIFITPQGTRFETTYNDDNSYTINLLSGTGGDIQEVYALYPINGSSEKFYTLGRLNAISYPAQTHKLTVVQVTKNKIDEQALKDKLKEVYAPVGVTWEVSFDNGFDYNGELSGFFDKNSRLLSAYNEKMSSLQEAYKKYKGNLDGEMAYFFILNDSGDGKNRDTQGFMPQGKQFGYIFLKNIEDSKEDVNQIIAHELGHGRWKLSHTFDSTYGEKIAKADKVNLMSYGGGTHLARWQWDVMDSPAWFVDPLRGDDKGMWTGTLLESESILNPGFEAIFYIGNKKYLIEFGEQLKNVSNNRLVTHSGKTYIVVRLVNDNSLSGFYEEQAYVSLKDAKDGSVNLASKEALLIPQFTNYRIKEVIELSKGTTELKDALLKDNDFTKVQAIITLRQALSEDEYLSVFEGYEMYDDCRIDLNVSRKYTDECLDLYIEALAKGLNSEAEYFDKECNCIVKRSNEELLGKSDSGFQEWFAQMGGAKAIKEIENRIYDTNIARYTDNIARGIYGANEYGMVNIPQSIKEKVRKEARNSAFPTIKAIWAIERSGADPDGLLYNFSPISFERFSYYYYRALAATSNDDAKEILTDVGLQVGIQWAFEIFPAMTTAKANIKNWQSVKIKPDNLIASIESKGYRVADANEEYILITGDQLEGKVPIVARNLDNVVWTEFGKWKKYPSITMKIPKDMDGRLIGRYTNGKFELLEKNVNFEQSWDFIVTTEGEFLIGRKHSWMSEGRGVLAVGEVRIRNGEIIQINNLSGHYIPTPQEASNFLKIFNDANINIEKATLTIYDERVTIYKQVHPTSTDRNTYLR